MLEDYFSSEEIETLRRCDNLEIKCLRIIAKLFDGRTDKCGKPYLGHLLRVSERLTDKDERCAALLHDTLEDIEGFSADMLLYLGIPQNVVDMVVLLTKTKGRPYDEEINGIIRTGNDGALRIKFSDMLDNSSPERLCDLDEETRTRLTNKYSPQLKKLKLELKKRGIEK